MEAKIKEIFPSIQGEGLVIGCKQLFIRFCGCNLKCKYCDTDFKSEGGISYLPENLVNRIVSNYDLATFHSISLTGGEPLLHAEFLKEFLILLKKKFDVKIYLETNATLADELALIKDYVDIVAADIKLNSSSGTDTFYLHRKFFEKCNGVQTFAKVVFDENITEDEVSKCTRMAKDFDIELILQPKMVEDKPSVDADFCEKIMDKFTSQYKNTRLIPQMHKFLNIR